MAQHCKCARCKACPAPGTAFALPEEIKGQDLRNGYGQAGQNGFFVHLASANYQTIVSREIFEHEGAMWVGASGRYYSSEDQIRLRSDKGLDNLDISNSNIIKVVVNQVNNSRIYKTRHGNLVEGSELTVRLDCGGSLKAESGVITVGTVGGTVACQEPAQGCCAVQ